MKGFSAYMHSSPALDVLLAQQSRFRAFVVSRLGNEADADDLLQSSLLKAMRSADTLRDDQQLVSWFYRILRHTIIDHIRSRNATRARENTWAENANLENDDEAKRHICHCFEALLPELKPTEAELLRRVELQNETVADAARALDITPNNASVTLHRARRSLRRKLENFCGSCASEGCLDCDCDTAPKSRQP